MKLQELFTDNAVLSTITPIILEGYQYYCKTNNFEVSNNFDVGKLSLKDAIAYLSYERKYIDETITIAKNNLSAYSIVELQDMLSNYTTLLSYYSKIKAKLNEIDTQKIKVFEQLEQLKSQKI